MRNLLVFAVFASWSSLALAFSAAGLKCEYWSDPRGIDVAQPRLSWSVESDERGQRQTAYQVLVASTLEGLLAEKADLWDSGRIASDDTVNISYAGKTLASSQQVFWRVRAWDVNSRVSAWSAVASWTMGLLHENDWSAKWISAAGAEKYAISYPEAARHDFSDRKAFATKHPNAVDTPEPNYSSLLARREFVVRPGLVRAVAHVSGLGQFVLSVNGRPISDAFLSPGWTDYRKTVLYETFDITKNLRAGANAIGFLLGNGMYNIQPDFVRYVKFLNSYGPLKAIGVVKFEYVDGSVETLATDKSWQVSPGPVTYSNIFGGEDYDANREQRGWDSANFNPAREWSPALETQGPGGQLKGLSASAPPLRPTATLTPLRRTQIAERTYVYDLGQNASIIPRVRVRGPRGAAVRITPAELLGADGKIDRSSATQDGVRPAWWQYTIGETGVGEWTPQFFYQGARYLQVELYPPDNDTHLPVVEDLVGLVVHTSAEPIGEFSSSNELFNRIYTLIRWAQRSNLVSVITDCPHREKMGWLEQYHLNGPSLRYNFDLLTLFRKAMNDMADSQLENGFVPNIAPEFFIAGGEDVTNGFRNSPEWGSSFILVPWQQYLFSGDTSLIVDYYPRMKRYLAFLDSISDHDLLKIGLGDWYDLGPKPPWGSQLTPPPLTATAIYYYDNVVMAQMAKLAGQKADAENYERRASEIRARFNAAFFNAEKGIYATGSQTANAMGLFFGFAEPADENRITDALVNDIESRGNSFTSGDVGYRFLLKALAMEGHSDLIFKMNNQTEKPGYGYQLKMGATSLTEKWDAGVGSFGSQNHFMLGQINEWFFHDLAGIANDDDAPGFKHIIVKPSVVGDLEWVRGSYASVKGPISTSWRRENGRFTLEVHVPANATATVYIPAKEGAVVTESGVPAERSPHVQYQKRDGDSLVYAIESGRYVFSVDSR